MSENTTISQSIKIDRLALVDPKAELAEGVEVGPFTVIDADVRIGKGTKIASHARIINGTTIGENCSIGNGTILGTLPQYLGFNPEEKTTVEIGNNTIFREYCTVNRGTSHRGKTTVGSNCYLMTYSHVGHDADVGNNVVMANGVNIGGHVIVEEFAGIGGMTPIHEFCKVGCHAFVGGGYRIVKDVPPYILASGEPLQYTGLNFIGLTRRGFKPETIAEIKSVYRILYHQKGLNVSQALQKIKAEITITPVIEQIIKFIESSERGIIR